MTDDIFFATIPDLNARLKKREFSAVELVKAFADRLEKLGPRYNALALPLTKSAVKRAKDIDDEMKRERYRGSAARHSLRREGSAFAFAGQVPPRGARSLMPRRFSTRPRRCLRSWTRPAALLIGKLAMVELAGGGGYRTRGRFAVRAGLESVGHHPLVGRFVERFGQRGGGWACAVCAGFGDVGIDPYAVCILRRHRSAADLRPGQPPRRHGAFLDDGQDRADVPQRRRLRSGASDDRGRRFEGPRLRGKKLLLHAAICPETHRSEDRFRADDMGWADPAARPAFQAAMQVMREIGVQMVEVQLPDFPYGAARRRGHRRGRGVGLRDADS